MIEFHAEDHSYWLDDIRVPGVSEIIEGVGLMDANAKQFYTQYHSDRGTAVHAATVMIDNGTLDESSIDPEIVGYLEAYKKFLVEYEPMWLKSEYLVFDKKLFYAGRLDRYGYLCAMQGVVDIKTGQKTKWHAIQLALYALAMGNYFAPDALVFGLYLHKDGSFKASRDLVNYTDPEIFKVAEAATRLFHWRQK